MYDVCIQNLLAPGSVGNRAGVEDLLVLIIGGRSNDMKKTLEEAARARAAGIRIIVVGVSDWINDVELAGVASYPYQSTRLLLPAGFGSLPSIHDKLRDMICNSTWTFHRSLSSSLQETPQKHKRSSEIYCTYIKT